MHIHRPPEPVLLSISRFSSFRRLLSILTALTYLRRKLGVLVCSSCRSGIQLLTWGRSSFRNTIALVIISGTVISIVRLTCCPSSLTASLRCLRPLPTPRLCLVLTWAGTDWRAFRRALCKARRACTRLEKLHVGWLLDNAAISGSLCESPELGNAVIRCYAGRRWMGLFYT